MFLPIAAYLFLSIAISITGGLSVGLSVALCGIGTSFLSLVAGGGLKASLCSGDKAQKIGGSLIALLLMGLAQWVSLGFSAHFFGHFLSGSLWSWIGFVICFFFSNKKLLGTQPIALPEGKAFFMKSSYSVPEKVRLGEETTDPQKRELAQQYFEKGDDYYYAAQDEDGTKREQGFVEAAKWLLKAAELGNNDAQYGLALTYCNGEGVPKDYVQAHKWFYLSSETQNVGTTSTLPNPSAEEQLEDIEKYMTPKQLAEARRLAREWKPK